MRRSAAPMLCTFVALACATFMPARDGDAAKVTLTAKDNDGKVKLRKGDTLVVRLEGSAGTGYSWFIAKNNQEVLKPKGEPKVLVGEGKKIGGARTWEFTLQAVGAGASELALEYKRPFEKDKPPAKAFGARVTVVD